MTTWITLKRLQALIDLPIDTLRDTLPLTNSKHDSKIAYGHMTKGELVIEHLQEHWNATDERTK